jgi:hypothetical protein
MLFVFTARALLHVRVIKRVEAWPPPVDGRT